MMEAQQGNSREEKHPFLQETNNQNIETEMVRLPDE